jgi:hypothetical protein
VLRAEEPLQHDLAPVQVEVAVRGGAPGGLGLMPAVLVAPHRLDYLVAKLHSNGPALLGLDLEQAAGTCLGSAVGGGGDLRLRVLRRHTHRDADERVNFFRSQRLIGAVWRIYHVW